MAEIVFADKVIEEARTFLHTPWVHTARVKGHGVDCLGLAVLSYNSSGAHLVDRTNYTMHDEFFKLLREIKKDFYRVKGFDNMCKADVILFREPRSMYNHIGLFTGQKDSYGRFTFIHAYADKAVNMVVEESYSPYWKSLTLGVYRHTGIHY